MTVAIEPAHIVVLQLQPGDVLFINADAVGDLDQIRGNCRCPIIPVVPRPGMTVADELAVVRPADKVPRSSLDSATYPLSR